MDIEHYLRLMTDKQASDLFLSAGAPVYIKIEGTLLAIGDSLAGEEVARACGLDSGAIREVAATTIEALAGSPLRD